MRLTTSNNDNDIAMTLQGKVNYSPLCFLFLYTKTKDLSWYTSRCHVYFIG